MRSNIIYLKSEKDPVLNLEDIIKIVSVSLLCYIMKLLVPTSSSIVMLISSYNLIDSPLGFVGSVGFFLESLIILCVSKVVVVGLLFKSLNPVFYPIVQVVFTYLYLFFNKRVSLFSSEVIRNLLRMQNAAPLVFSELQDLYDTSASIFIAVVSVLLTRLLNEDSDSKMFIANSLVNSTRRYLRDCIDTIGPSQTRVKQLLNKIQSSQEKLLSARINVLYTGRIDKITRRLKKCEDALIFVEYFMSFNSEYRKYVSSSVKNFFNEKISIYISALDNI